MIKCSMFRKHEVVRCAWKAAMGEGKSMYLESLFRVGLPKSYFIVEAVRGP